MDIENFLQEISADEPCGADFEYDSDFIALEKIAEGKPEQQIGDHIEPAEPPNWREVRGSAEALLARTHDLRVLTLYVRALLHTDGFRGLRDGLTLLRASVERFWETIHPQLDPDDEYDPTQRVNILMSLCDADAMLRPVRLAPLIEARAVGKFNLRDAQIASGKLAAAEGESAPSKSSIGAAMSAMGEEELKGVLQAVEDSIHALHGIEAFVTDQVGVSQAPNFAPLNDILKEARALVREGTPGEIESEQGENENNTPGFARGNAAGTGVIGGRGDVVRAIDQICAYYRNQEPSSPVPILLQRARRLVDKDFVALLQDLVPDALGQFEIIKGRDESDSY